jgi:UDPglucose 6-dehydrogenase
VRDSVAILIADELSQMGAIVRAYDPQGMQQARKILGNAIAYCASADDALEDADLCVIATEWNEFRDKKPIAYKRLMAEPVMVDLRNVFSPDEMAEHGFTYVSVGRSAVERKVLQGRPELAGLGVSRL